MYSIFSTPLIFSSSGAATVSAMTFGFAPGYCALIVTEGGTTSGYSEIGNLNIAINPASRITTDSTPAKIGRSMKNFDMFINDSLSEAATFSQRCLKVKKDNRTLKDALCFIINARINKS